MSNSNRRRRQKRRRDQRAAQAAAQAVRTAEAMNAQANRKAKPDPVTDISALRVSVEDVMAAGVRTEPMRWVIVRCVAMAERKVMTALQEHRIMAYLPMHRFYRRPRGVLLRAERPLLVGYVFVGLAPHQSEYDLHEIDGVAGLLKSDGVTARINPWTIVQIAAMEATGAFDHTGPRKPAYTKDQLVRIVSGWAKGHQAKVVEASDGGLRVEFPEGIFKGCEMPFAEDHVEAVDIGEAA